MKNTILTLIVLVAMTACKKDPFDYRTKYVGDYNFVVERQTIASPDGNVSDTTYTLEGTIDYGSDDNAISILFSGNNTPETFTLYEDGTIRMGTACSGEFESTNRIKYSCYWASPGAHTDQNVSGVKK